MTIELLSLSSSLSIQSNLSLLTKGAIDEGAIDEALIERQEKTTVSLLEGGNKIKHCNEQ